jgi:hypothetical protein
VDREKKENRENSGRIIQITPSSKGNRRLRLSATISPQTDVLDATVDGDLQGLVDRVEDESITALPNIPCDGNADRLILIRLGAGEHDVLCGDSGEDLSSRKDLSYK